MTTYLLDDDVNYMILLFYILKDLDADILLSTVYTITGEEVAKISELYKAFLQYKRITKGTLFYIKFYSVTAEILYDEIKPTIQVIKIGLTREMIIPEKIDIQEEIQKINIPEFYANKRTSINNFSSRSIFSLVSFHNIKYL